MWADSLWRRLAPWFALKQFADRDWRNYYERSGYARRRSDVQIPGYVIDLEWGDWVESDAMFLERILGELSHAR